MNVAPEGPGMSWIDAPVVPPLAADVTFVSPLLTAEARGKSASERILIAASQCYGEQKFRDVLQLVAIFTLNNQREVSEIRIFSRTWSVTAYLRRCMYDLLKDSLGPEYWQGPDPEGPLPI